MVDSLELTNCLLWNSIASWNWPRLSSVCESSFPFLLAALILFIAWFPFFDQTGTNLLQQFAEKRALYKNPEYKNYNMRDRINAKRGIGFCREESVFVSQAGVWLRGSSDKSSKRKCNKALHSNNIWRVLLTLHRHIRTNTPLMILSSPLRELIVWDWVGWRFLW